MNEQLEIDEFDAEVVASFLERHWSHFVEQIKELGLDESDAEKIVEALHGDGG